MRSNPDCLSRLQAAGFDYEDACALRRISMTLRRWHELECGDSNDYASWVITRGNYLRPEGPPTPGINGSSIRRRDPKKVFVHDEDGKPFLERHVYGQSGLMDYTVYEALPDRERGALKRLGKIMARYPGFAYYVQGDPRGCALYILRPTDIPADVAIDSAPAREWLSANYSRGIAVHK